MSQKTFTPEQLKKARVKLGFPTQAGLGEALEKSERYITYRESGKQPVSKMMRYALSWLLLPKKVRDKYLPRFMR